MRRLLDTHTFLCVALGDRHQAGLGPQRHGGFVSPMGYVTKNGFKIGFFVNSSLNPSPSFFCSAREAESAFLPTEQLPQLGALIEKGIDYLKSITPS